MIITQLVCAPADLSLRVRLARLLAVDDELDSTLDAPLGFSSSSQATLPSRLILCGAAASNPAMVALLSTVMNAPAYFLDPTTELARSTHGTRPELSDDLEGDDRAYATSSGYGAALFAAWVLARSADEGQADVGFQEYVAQKREQSWSSSPSAAAPERDSEGITLVAQPDATEHRYYNSSELVSLVELSALLTTSRSASAARIRASRDQRASRLHLNGGTLDSVSLLASSASRFVAWHVHLVYLLVVVVPFRILILFLRRLVLLACMSTGMSRELATECGRVKTVVKRNSGS